MVLPETEPFWNAAAEERYVLPHCEDCDDVFYYPRAHCPDCFGEILEWVEVSGRGVIYSYSVVNQLGGWPEDGLPLVVAFVELEEGPRVMTDVVDCDPEDVSIDDAVEVRFESTDEDDVAVPVFELAT